MRFKLITSVVLGLVFSSWGINATSADADLYHQFQYEAELNLNNQTTLQQLELPWEVVATLKKRDAGDLRIYNADQQIVPHRFIEPPQEELTQQASLVNLEFYHTNKPEEIATLIKLNGDQATLIQLQQAVSHSVILAIPDAARQGMGVQHFELRWSTQNTLIPSTLKAEYSDNLRDWSTANISAFPYSLMEQDKKVINQQLVLGKPINVRFLRLSGSSEVNELLDSITKVQTHFTTLNSTKPKAKLWQSISLLPTANPQQWRVDWSVAVQASQWRLSTKKAGDYYQGQILVPYEYYRNHTKKVSWSTQDSFQYYFITTPKGELQAPAQKLYSLPSTWVLDFKVPNPLLVNQVPTLEVEWQPPLLQFIAQGKPPFKLRYSSEVVFSDSTTELKLDILPFLSNNTATIKSIARLSTSPINEVKVPKENISKINNTSLNTKLLLWFVLIAAVGVLVWIALRLLKEVQQDKPN